MTPTTKAEARRMRAALRPEVSRGEERVGIGMTPGPTEDEVRMWKEVLRMKEKQSPFKAMNAVGSLVQRPPIQPQSTARMPVLKAPRAEPSVDSIQELGSMTFEEDS